MDPWTRGRWRRRWRRVRPLIMATVLAAIVVLILLLLVQHLMGELKRTSCKVQRDRPPREQGTGFAGQ